MTSHFDIRPLRGVGPIDFGMTVADVRRLFAGTPESRKRTPSQKHPYDFYEDLDFFVYYDADGTVEAVEFGASASVQLDGVQLSRLTAAGLAQLDAHTGQPFVERSGSYISNGLGIAIWFPSLDEPAGSVLAFRSGYYK